MPWCIFAPTVAWHIMPKVILIDLLNVFKANEEKALQLAAQKCKQYGITPSASTIMLHQEVYAKACPHRSVEIHGGAAQTKAYFINRIKELMNGNQSTTTDQEGEETMQCMFTVKGKGCVYWMHDGVVTALQYHIFPDM